MALFYRAKVEALTDTLSDESHREAAAERLRKLIDKIVLTPVGDRTMTADLYGELGGILLMSTEKTPAYQPNTNGDLSFGPSR